MKLQSFYPVLMTRDPAALADFYRNHFGFETTFEMDWYISLRREGENGAVELAILDGSHATIPPDFRSEVRGLILNFEVPDAQAEHERLVRVGGLPEVQPLRDEAFGQRHFMVRDPAGNLVDVIEPIEPAPEFAAAFGAAEF
jgi:catechol 2,3-dioxygenase-like lactoylglutathione lyase family enzyme